MASDVTLQELETMNTNYYFTLVSMSILILDYFLTLPAEVERFWCVGRLNWASGLFYLNRYMVLFGHIPIMVEYFWTTSNPAKIQMSVCQSLQSYHQYLAIAIQLVVACMLIMRTYALYERSRKVLALYIGVSAVAVAVGCWAVLGGKTTHKPQDTSVPIGCGVSLTHYQAIRLGAAWGGMLVFDFLVFAMTLYKSLTLPRTAGTNLLSVLFRDGAIYFGVMMAANLGNILTFMYGGPYTRGVATTFTNIISSVMISRLMLNLRHPALVTHSECTSCPTATDFTTNPNLTFLYSTQYTDETRGSDPERHVGRPEHDYVTRGPGRPMGRNDNDIELVLFDRQNQV